MSEPGCTCNSPLGFCQQHWAVEDEPQPFIAENAAKGSTMTDLSALEMQELRGVDGCGKEYEVHYAVTGDAVPPSSSRLRHWLARRHIEECDACLALFVAAVGARRSAAPPTPECDSNITLRGSDVKVTSPTGDDATALEAAEPTEDQVYALAMRCGIASVWDGSTRHQGEAFRCFQATDGALRRFAVAYAKAWALPPLRRTEPSEVRDLAIKISALHPPTTGAWQADRCPQWIEEIIGLITAWAGPVSPSLSPETVERVARETMRAIYGSPPYPDQRLAQYESGVVARVVASLCRATQEEAPHE